LLHTKDLTQNSYSAPNTYISSLQTYVKDTNPGFDHDQIKQTFIRSPSDPYTTWQKIESAKNWATQHGFSYLFDNIPNAPSEKKIPANIAFISAYEQKNLQMHLVMFNTMMGYWLRNFHDANDWIATIPSGNLFTGSIQLALLYKETIHNYFHANNIRPDQYFDTQIKTADPRNIPFAVFIDKVRTQYKLQKYLRGRTHHDQYNEYIRTMFRLYSSH
jgi:hypothetical protein